MIAIGVGCRRGAPTSSIGALIRDVLAQAPAMGPCGLFSIQDKAGEPGLIEAASRLGLPLTFLSRADLLAQAAAVQTRSSHAERRFGVPSVAEAAALAGAGPNAVLILPRVARNGVTCAIAGAP